MKKSGSERDFIQVFDEVIKKEEGMKEATAGELGNQESTESSNNLIFDYVQRLAELYTNKFNGTVGLVPKRKQSDKSISQFTQAAVFFINYKKLECLVDELSRQKSKNLMPLAHEILKSELLQPAISACESCMSESHEQIKINTYKEQIKINTYKEYDFSHRVARIQLDTIRVILHLFASLVPAPPLSNRTAVNTRDTGLFASINDFNKIIDVKEKQIEMNHQEAVFTVLY